MKKRLIFTKDSPDTFKVGDTDSTLSMQLVDTSDDVNTPVDPSSFQSVKMVIRSKDYYLRDLTPAITKDSVTVNSSDLADLPAGSYYFEAWATTKAGKAEVYPDYGFLGFEITQNGYYQAGAELAGVAVDKLRDEFHKYVDDRLAAQKPVDLSDYVKSEQLAEYAKKQDVPVVAYDSAKNTLSINGQSWELQQKIDLSAYAKKSDIPVVGLDVKDRTLSINGVKVDIPAKVDLAQYVTSEQFNEAVQAFPVVTYDSSKNDLEVNGQKVPLVSDQDVDNKLIGYAKKTDLPVLTLDTTKRTLNVNGVSINIPAEVDLSGYAKTSEVPKVTYDATNKKLTVDGVDVPLTGGQSEDLSKYVTKDSINSDDSFWRVSNKNESNALNFDWNSATLNIAGYKLHPVLADGTPDPNNQGRYNNVHLQIMDQWGNFAPMNIAFKNVYHILLPTFIAFDGVFNFNQKTSSAYFWNLKTIDISDTLADYTGLSVSDYDPYYAVIDRIQAETFQAGDILMAEDGSYITFDYDSVKTNPDGSLKVYGVLPQVIRVDQKTFINHEYIDKGDNGPIFIGSNFNGNKFANMRIYLRRSKLLKYLYFEANDGSIIQIDGDYDLNNNLTIAKGTKVLGVNF